MCKAVNKEMPCAKHALSHTGIKIKIWEIAKFNFLIPKKVVQSRELPIQSQKCDKHCQGHLVCIWEAVHSGDGLTC